MRRIVDVFRRSIQRIVDVFRGSIRRFFELEGFDRAMALAGQGFAALLPLLIVIGAISPPAARDASAAIIDRLELSGSSADAVRQAVAQPAAVEDGVSVLSFFILVVSALAFTRALQRLYVRAWRLEKIGVRGNAWGLEWLAVLAVYLSLQPAIVGLFDGALATGVSLAATSAMWLFTPWILIGRRVPWHRLLPQAVLTALGLTALGARVGALHARGGRTPRGSSGSSAWRSRCCPGCSRRARARRHGRGSTRGARGGVADHPVRVMRPPRATTMGADQRLGRSTT